MNVGMVSKRYAKALLEYAVDKKAEDKIYSTMKTLAKQFTNVPQLSTAMVNPVLNEQDKLDLLSAAVDNKADEVFVNFVRLVLKRHRETYLHSMALCYCDLYCESKNINTGKLVTATAVDEATVAKMKALVQQVRKQEIDFESSIDPNIQGGFILYFDTYRYDASIQTQLDKIRQQLITDNNKLV